VKTALGRASLALNQHDLGEVCRILSECVPEYGVWAFGSRITGKAKPYSDLDLVVLADQPLTLDSLASIKDAFDESDLPIRVDVVDWAATSAAFREIILQNYVVLQQGGGSNRENK
jgi:predicted nucleotidyltransferase